MIVNKKKEKKMRTTTEAVARRWSTQTEKCGKLVVTVKCLRWNNETRAMEEKDEPFELFVGGFHYNAVKDWELGTAKSIMIRANGEKYKDKNGETRYSSSYTFDGFSESGVKENPYADLKKKDEPEDDCPF